MVSQLPPFNGSVLFHCMGHPHFHYPVITDGGLSCFCLGLLSSMLLQALMILTQVFVWRYVFISPGCVPERGIARSSCDSILKVWKNCQTPFQSGCTTLHSTSGEWVLNITISSPTRGGVGLPDRWSHVYPHADVTTALVLLRCISTGTEKCESPKHCLPFAEMVWLFCVLSSPFDSPAQPVSSHGSQPGFRQGSHVIFRSI